MTARLCSILVLSALASGPAFAQADPLTVYRAKTAASIPCSTAADPDEILVCGRRDADRYRVPLLVAEPGDPRREGMWDERERLQAKSTPCQDRGPFLIKCGMVGATVGTRTGVVLGGERPLAP